jgi:hypothetical protein
MSLWEMELAEGGFVGKQKGTSSDVSRCIQLARGWAAVSRDAAAMRTRHRYSVAAAQETDAIYRTAAPREERLTSDRRETPSIPSAECRIEYHRGREIPQTSARTTGLQRCTRYVSQAQANNFKLRLQALLQSPRIEDSGPECKMLYKSARNAMTKTRKKLYDEFLEFKSTFLAGLDSLSSIAVHDGSSPDVFMLR